MRFRSDEVRRALVCFVKKSSRRMNSSPRNIETLRQECGDGTQENFAEEDHILKLVQRWACGEVTELPVEDVLKYSVLDILRRNGYLKSAHDKKNKRKGRSGRRREFEEMLIAEMVDANSWHMDAEGGESNANGDGDRQPVADADAAIADIADWNTPVLNRMTDNASNADTDGDECHFAHRMCMSFEMYFTYLQGQAKM